ncbi:hypothetical protein FQN52_009355 [Onygenales sp. PD_12]|nr:hypothetical protein FQN52_009355 [Onygenales sp. PD_12]
MTSDVYDSDDARNASPRLKPQQIDYNIHETPPPFILKEDSSPDKRSPRGRDRKGPPHRRRKKPKKSLADVLILDSIVGRRLAYEYGENPLPDDSATDSSYSDEDVAVDTTGKGQDALMEDITGSSAQQTAQQALSLFISDSTPAELPPATIKRDKVFSEELRPLQPNPPDFLEPRAEAPPVHNVPSPIDKLPRSPKQEPPQTQDRGKDSVATSPTLRKYTLSTSGCASGETLPALQSRPESISNSPENSQNLPSISDALFRKPLNDYLGPINGAPQRIYHHITASSPPQPLPPVERPNRRRSEQYIPPPLTSGSSSFLSPESSRDISSLSPITNPQSQPPYWQPPVLEKEGSYTHSPGGPSPQFSDSPSSSYPTPTELGKAGSYDSPPQTNGHAATNGPLNSTGFKCPFLGCKADPFQTQYLLNSHANVHSHVRPYYCSVRGCPRAEGGKGFKRKNEMKRHGLVHDSPGYICPFCTDQTHTYPRPDNLQRHVKVHHVDKDREDPALRRVLSQRPEGGMRGRRRRT